MNMFRKGSMLLATASLFALPAPSLAAVDGAFGGLYPDADIACDDILTPNDNSGFTTYATGVVAGGTSSVTVDTGPTVTTGVGTPTVSITNYRGAHQNGQSVNIHAYGDRSTVYPSSIETTPKKTTVTTTYNVTCHVHKETNGNDKDDLHEGYNIAPPGLNAKVGATTFVDEEEILGQRQTPVPGPWTDPNASEIGAKFVICISPTKNPGTWRGQNGYTNQIEGKICSRAWYDSLGSTPSVSVPSL